MFDSFNRKIEYLRISVTDRCNFRCTYCMPVEGVAYVAHADVLSFEKICGIVKIASSHGLRKVRLTGGEPLVRKDIVDLVRMISQIDGIEDLALTTNGVLLPKYADQLRTAGLHRVNISLDTLDKDLFAKVTRGGNVDEVLAGIEAAKAAGLNPIKINVVRLVKELNQNIDEVREFCERNDLGFRIIRQMDLQSGEFSVVEGGEGGNCSICNRIRLTAKGILKPCLFSDQEYDTKEFGIETALKMCVENKPSCGTTSMKNEFYNVGG